ncbi:MAG TPA: glycosyltransferase [Gammaproteobacteria bacterium]|nr:glycosyltransferase [Gammaproteobacteria bacterium]
MGGPKSAAAKADQVICHGGHGTVSAALLKGRPLLLLPLNLEQRMLAARGFAERHAGFEVQGIPGRFATLVEKLFASEAV